MSNILENVVKDQNLVWGKNLENHPEKFLVILSNESINELKSNRQFLNIDKKFLEIY